MTKYNNVQDLGIVLGLALLGTKMGVFDNALDNCITKANFFSLATVDNEYFNKWLDAAVAYDFLEVIDDKIYLTEFGKSFAKNHENTQLANLIQGVYSVLISNEAISYLETGERPGYQIVNKFEKIAPWFDYVNQKKNDPLLNEIFSNSNFSRMIENMKGNIADFSCGNGWFLKNIREKVNGCTLYGVNGNVLEDSYIIRVSTVSFLEGNKKYNLIVLNKVLHHIWYDEVLIKNILDQLTETGILMLWEFNWSEDIKINKKYKEVVFLNFVEHIQNAGYIPVLEIRERFEKMGFVAEWFTIDDGAQVIFIIRKK